MGYQLVPLQKQHKTDVMNIFNYYIENSFSAYFSNRLPDECFDSFLQSCNGFPAYAVENESGKAVGFGMLRPFHPGDAVSRTGELSYFIAPEHTRQRLGKLLLDRIIEDAAQKGIDSLVASVSSQNEKSLAFHKRNGFREAGKLKSAGRKFEQDFDIILFQKNL